MLKETRKTCVIVFPPPSLCYSAFPSFNPPPPQFPRLSVTLSSPHTPAPRLSTLASPLPGVMSAAAAVIAEGGRHAPVARRPPPPIIVMYADEPAVTLLTTLLPCSEWSALAGGGRGACLATRKERDEPTESWLIFFCLFVCFVGIKWGADNELSVLPSCFHGTAAAGLVRLPPLKLPPFYYFYLSREANFHIKPDAPWYETTRHVFNMIFFFFRRKLEE